MICEGKGIELGKLISKGKIVYIKHSGMYEPSLSVIHGISEREIHLIVSKNFLESNVSKGDNILCQLLEGDYEYIIQGCVNHINAASPAVMSIGVEKVSKFKNNRLFKRYPVKFEAHIYMAGSKNTIKGTVNNISIIGIGISSGEHIHRQSIVTLRIATFISNDRLLEFKARVVRANKSGDSYEYGMEIIEIDAENKDMLDKIIFCLNTNENIFIGDLLK